MERRASPPAGARGFVAGTLAQMQDATALFTECVEGVFSEVRGLGRPRLWLQETHGSHLGPRIEPVVLYSLIL